MDGRALIFHIERAASRHSCCLHEALRELHHALKIGEGLIGFHRGELGVVIRVHVFVAELAADLKNLLEAAYEQALQRKLGCDAQEVIAIERVEMRGEGLRVRAAHDRMQEGRFDLVETLLFHVVADSRDDLRALHEGLVHLGVHDQVDIPLTIAQFLVGQAVELFRQGAQRFREQLVGIDRHGKLATTRTHHKAGHADPIAHIQILHSHEGFFAQRIDATEQLDRAGRIAQLHEDDLALIALGHHATSHLYAVFGVLAIFKTSVFLVEVDDVM